MKAKKLFVPFLLAVLSLASCALGTDSAAGHSSSSSSTSSVDTTPTITIASARSSAVGTTVVVEGVMQYDDFVVSNPDHPYGFWIADTTGCIYIFDYEELLVHQVNIGATVKIRGKIGYRFLDGEEEAAGPLSYRGRLMINEAELLASDRSTVGGHPDGSYSDSTIDNLANTPLSTDISGNMYMVKGREWSITKNYKTTAGLQDPNRVDTLTKSNVLNGDDPSGVLALTNPIVRVLILIVGGNVKTAKWEYLLINTQESYNPDYQKEAAYGACRATLEFAKSYSANATLTISIADPRMKDCKRSFSSTSSQVSITTTSTDNVISIDASTTGTIDIKAVVNCMGLLADVTFPIEITSGSV